jgi:hypothetical protein
MTPAELALGFANRDLVTLTMALIAFGLVVGHFVFESSPLPFIRDHRRSWVKGYDTLLIIGWLAAFALISFAKIS